MNEQDYLWAKAQLRLRKKGKGGHQKHTPHIWTDHFYDEKYYNEIQKEIEKFEKEKD